MPALQLRSGNPALRADTFTSERAEPAAGVMTIEGAVNRTIVAIAILVAAAVFAWKQLAAAEQGLIPTQGLFVAALIGAPILGLVTVFWRRAAPFTTPVYAALEGLLLGTVSTFFEAAYRGIVIEAVALTFGTLIALLFCYKTGLIRATENFKLGIFAATAGIGLAYLMTWLLSLFGVHVPFIHDTGLIGIGFSFFVVGIAALNLVLDFDFIEQGAAVGAPKYMEWYAAFGLLVTLVWLYLEILRLLAKLQSRGRD
jgi:uncharacterized YccA/Bax inhibitor family protein